MKTRVQALALAGVLALTALTGGAAAVGLSHWGSSQPAAAPAGIQLVQAPAGQFEPEGSD